jgi:hypothetical protein
MPSDHVSIDEFLKNQSVPKFTGTVEEIESKPDFVKVTPWSAAARGCLCHLAINIRKSALEGVTLTGDIHVCCGKNLKIVELHFKKGETIGAEDVFSQLSQSAHESTESHHARHVPFPSNPMPGVSYKPYPSSLHFGRRPPAYRMSGGGGGGSNDCFTQHTRCLSLCAAGPDGNECREICWAKYEACKNTPSPEPHPYPLPYPYPNPLPSPTRSCFQALKNCSSECRQTDSAFWWACELGCADRYRFCLSQHGGV